MSLPSTVPKGLTWPKFRSYYKGISATVVSKEWEKYKNKNTKISASKAVKTSPKKTQLKKSSNKNTPKKNNKVIKKKSAPKTKVTVKKNSPVKSSSVFPTKIDTKDRRFVLIVDLHGKKLKKGENNNMFSNTISEIIDKLAIRIDVDFRNSVTILDYDYHEETNYPTASILKQLRDIQTSFAKFYKAEGYTLDIHNYSDYYFGDEQKGMLDIVEVLDIKHNGYRATKKVNFKNTVRVEIDSETINLNTIRRFWLSVSNEIEAALPDYDYTFSPKTKPKKNTPILEYILHVTKAPSDAAKYEDYFVALEIIVESVHESKFTPASYRLEIV